MWILTFWRNILSPFSAMKMETVCEISDAHRIECEDESLLVYSAVLCRWSRPTFQRCVLSPSSG
jgi:hypothetical protein